MTHYLMEVERIFMGCMFFVFAKVIRQNISKNIC